MSTRTHRRKHRSTEVNNVSESRIFGVIARIPLVLLLFGVAGFATYLSHENIRYATIREAAKLEARGNVFTTEQLATLMALPEAQAFKSSCRTDVLEPLSLLALELASRYNQAAEYDKWASAVGAADQLIGHRIACTPTNGDLWLRDSLLSRAISEEPQTLSRSIALAHRLAPHDAAEIRGRFRLWTINSPATFLLAKPVAEMDVATILRYGDRKLTGELFSSQNPRLYALIRAELINVSEARKKLFPLWGIHYLDMYKR